MKVDVTVVGSGFAGSILAWILSSRGLSVALIDRVKHPRFAIGESSTPIADSILRTLSDDYQIPILQQLSCWGTWQQNYPDLPCGRKRGFSYLQHERGQAFHEDMRGSRSLLVAASPTDSRSDTHWYRPQVDAFLWQNAVDAGAIDLTGYEVVEIDVSATRQHVVHCNLAIASESDLETRSVTSDWVIDASGSSSVLSNFLHVEDWTRNLKTNTHSTFAHFEGVKGWGEVLPESCRSDFEIPFSADDAAQHHLLSDGWMWMLRFNHGVTSVGYTTSSRHPLPSFEKLRSDFPTIGSMMSDATLVAPDQGAVRSKRLQRWLHPTPSPRCIMLPTASLTLDPLHSTGIAHALAGVQRLSRLILEKGTHPFHLNEYTSVLIDETRLLDQLVEMAYRNLNCFDRFTVACMVYFSAAIHCEEAYQAGESPTHLWNASDYSFREFVNWVDAILDQADHETLQEIRKRLNPWNSAGLMDPAVENRYAYTATK